MICYLLRRYGKMKLLKILVFQFREILTFYQLLLAKKKGNLSTKISRRKWFLAIAIRPPTVPVGQSRIRITIRRNLDFNLLKNFIAVLKEFK